MTRTVVSFSNPEAVSDPTRLLVQTNIVAAFDLWAQGLFSTATIEIEVLFKAGMGTALATGGSITSAFIRTVDGDNLFQSGAAYELLTGIDKTLAGADIRMTIDLDDINEGRFFFDPTPTVSEETISTRQVDFVSVAAHEIGHGLGFNGWLVQNGLQDAALDYESVFDHFLQLSNGDIAFFGRQAVALNNGPVILRSGAHLSEANRGDDLMDPVAPAGGRISVSSLDFAILGDIGVPTIGNDFILAPSESANLNPGPGHDIINFAESRSSLSISTNGAVTSITSARYNWSVQNAERLEFTDGILALDAAGAAGQVYRLYQAAFARTPDTAGLKHNVGLVDGGLSLQQMSSAFLASAEFQQKYGSDPTDSAYINALYRNVLGRDADPAGLSGWQGRLNDGSWTRTTLLIGFSESPENIAKVAAAIANGIWLA
jgi:hypothetical protein